MSRIYDSSQTFKNLKNMQSNNRNLHKSVEKLSSGKRINHASDDAAGLAISSKLDARIRSSRQAHRNANDSVGILQVMHGGIQSINEMIIRMRELTTQAASDTISNKERAMLHGEVTELIKEVSRISQSNSINSRDLMKGNDERLEIQVGNNDGINNKIQLSLKDLAHDSYSLGIYDIQLDTKHHARLSIYKLDHALNETGRSIAKIGSLQSRLESVINNLDHENINSQSAKSRILDTDYAVESAKNIKGRLLQSSQTAVSSQALTSKEAALKLLK